MTEERSEYYSSKCPMFDGTEGNFLFYKTKFESYLARSDLGYLLTDGVGDQVDRDDVTLESTIAEQAVRIQKRKDNRKAAGILLNSIDTTTKEGKSAFLLISKVHDAATGYAGGYFHWKGCLWSTVRRSECVRPDSKIRST